MQTVFAARITADFIMTLLNSADANDYHYTHPEDPPTLETIHETLFTDVDGNVLREAAANIRDHADTFCSIVEGSYRPH